MRLFARTCIAILAVSILAGCAGSKGNNSLIKVFSGGSSSSSSSSNPQVQPIRLLQADEIRSTIAGKTFQYTRGDSTGLITFNADGTSSIEDDTKGGSSGTWQANDGELCETLSGGQSQCGPFKSTGDAYFAGKARFVEMKVN
jgi:hypothetical protein